MHDGMKELYAYDRWANARILGACAPVPGSELSRDLSGSFPSVLATLSHILAANWIWLERWHGRSPAGVPASWGLTDLPKLRERWGEVERGQARFVDDLEPADLERTVDYRNSAGIAFAAPLAQLMRHVVNHSTYHRGQVVTMLRQLGAEAVSTDLVLYHRERAAAVPTDTQRVPLG